MSLQIEFRGRKVQFEEIDDLRAVRSDRMQSREVSVRSTMKDLQRAARKVSTRLVPDDNRRVFESAGWVFAHNRESTLEAARFLSREPAQSVVRRILRNESGETLIESARLTIQFKRNRKLADITDFLGRYNLRLSRMLSFRKNLFEVVANSGSSIDAARELGAVGIDYAEPQLLQRIGGRLRPTDPRYGLQWQWNNDGSSGGLPGADVSAQAAWDKTVGRGIRIAVIDNGMDVTHPDLMLGLQGGGYFDDSGSGSAPFIPYQPNDPDFPPSNHGTFCLGMVGARLNNNEGGVGGAPESIMIPIACLRDQIGTQVTLARAIAYAADPTRENAAESADQGADVIACSLGPNGADWVMESVLMDAIDFAVDNGRGGKGTPVFWAVSNGNFPVNRDEVCSYQNTIAVGRSTRLDTDDGTAFGPELDFLAPGVEVYSTQQGGGYGFGTGTSYACPCAASVGGLILANDGTLTWQQLRDRMRASCDKIGGVTYKGKKFGGRHDRYGYGRINADSAIP